MTTPIVRAAGGSDDGSRRRRRRRAGAWAGIAVFATLALALAGLAAWREDILASFLDPQLPYAVYRPPAAPDYRSASAWVRLSGAPTPGDPPVDVFFIHSTTFDGGRDWNGPIDDRGAARRVARAVMPNYAAPFATSARVFAPRYRQASLYTSLSLFDDALQARAFAYGDVAAAFQSFLARIGPRRPFILAGVEQGAQLGDRLLHDAIESRPDLRRRLVAAYLIETATPAEEHLPGAATPACAARREAGCVVAWISAPRLDFVRSQRIMSRSVVWSRDGRLVPLAGRTPLCVNPLLGAASDEPAPARLNLGAANATGLEWGARPGFMARQVEARCEAGVLRISQPRSALLRPSGDWADRLRAAPYNLFWADLEADARARSQAWLSGNPQPAAVTAPSARQSNSARKTSSA